ncbi:MAG: hypothetical protein WCI73_02665, partial [Phycisphaerae bacterium]
PTPPLAVNEEMTAEPGPVGTTTPAIEASPVPPAATVMNPVDSVGGAVSAAELDALLCSSVSMEQAVAEALRPELNFASVEPRPDTTSASQEPTAASGPISPAASTPGTPETAAEPAGADGPANAPAEPGADSEGFGASPENNVATIEDEISDLPNATATDAPKNAAAANNLSAASKPRASTEPGVSSATPTAPPTSAPKAAATTTEKAAPTATPARRGIRPHIVKDIVLMAAQLLDMPFATIPPEIKQFLGICGALLVLGATLLLILASRH